VFSQLYEELDNYWKENRITDFRIQFSLSDNILPLTWGTTPISSFNQVIELVDKPKRFVVFGCSIGFQCFYFRSIYPDIPIVGYDIHPGRIEFAKEIAEKYSIENCEFILSDITNSQIMDGDCIWQNNLCIDDDLLNPVNFSILNKHSDIQIISYRPILDNLIIKGQILLIDVFGRLSKVLTTKTIKLETSWSKDQTFYLLK